MPKRILDADKHLGLEVECYYNLHRKCFSVRHKGKVIGHADSVWLGDAPRFRVSERGRQRVLREKKKNVHAYVKGVLRGWDLTQGEVETLQVAREITYNPYTSEGFHYRDDETGPLLWRVWNDVLLINKQIKELISCSIQKKRIS